MAASARATGRAAAEARGAGGGSATSSPPPPDGAEANAVAANPKKKGKGTVWTAPERVSLCEAYKTVTQDAVNGTSQTSNNMWAKVWFNFATRTSPNLTAAEMRGRWTNRHPTSAKTEFLRSIVGSRAHLYLDDT